MHTLLNLRCNIPTFIRITTGNAHDVNILGEIVPQADAYYAMDHGYLDYARRCRIHLAGSLSPAPSSSSMPAVESTIASVITYGSYDGEADLRG